MSAIELEGLVRRYGERAALDDVSLTLPAGTTLVVFGPNGAGKSTLLRILATLLRPTAGVARVLGHDVRSEGWRVRGQIGFLGHEPLLYGDLSARENLAYHARLHGLRRPAERIEEVLDAVARGSQPVQTRVIGEVLARAEVPVEQRLMTEEADAPADAPALAAHVVAEHARGAGARAQQRREDAQQGRLPRAVRPEDDERRPRRQRQRDVVEGRALAVAAHETLQLNGAHRAPRGRGWRRRAAAPGRSPGRAGRSRSGSPGSSRSACVRRCR